MAMSSAQGDYERAQALHGRLWDAVLRCQCAAICKACEEDVAFLFRVDVVPEKMKELLSRKREYL